MSDLVSHGISSARANHALIAIHVVVHYVFDNWLEGFLVYHVEVDFIICSDLYSGVAFHEVNKASFFAMKNTTSRF